MNYVKRIGINCFNLLQDIGVNLALWGMKKELARRDAERGRNNYQWLTPDEAVVVEALAKIIVPSDDETPGVDEVCVLGPPALEVLDKMIATSADRQQVYSRGLLSFDTWAVKERKCKFAEMREEDQIMLFRAAEQLDKDWSAGASPLVKAGRRLRAMTQAKSGSFFAGQLYSQVRNDCLQVFYTSRVSWVWLEYDGPPMDKGYLSLTEPR
jgi:hypothetical protein